MTIALSSANIPHLSEAARLAACAHRMLVASLLSLEAAAVEIAPEAEAELAELLDDADAFASELLRAAGGAAIDEVVRAGNEALDPPELPYGDAAYVEMWDRVAARLARRQQLPARRRQRGRSRGDRRASGGCT